MKQTFFTESTEDLAKIEMMKHNSEPVRVPHEVTLNELQDLLFSDISFPITIDLDTDEVL